MVILYIKNARQIDGDVNINGQSLRVDRLIASGSRMNVYVAYCEGRSYIVKQILVLERQQWPCVRHEVSVQRELEEHPNVVKILGERGFSEHASAEGIAGQHLLLLERAMYGDVEDVVRKFGRFEYKTAWKFFGQIVSVIGEMHRNGYYHGGVAPRNVFVFSKKLCKVGDFGNGNKLVPEFFNSQRITVKEIRDLLGAVDTLVSMLLGREPWSVKHHDSEEYQDFVGVEQPEDYERFVAKYPDWGSVMYMGDFWYIRKFYWENDSGAFFNIPIPVEYGKLRADELREFGQINVPKPIFDD